jgi:nitrate reductase gamma subunit
LRRKQLIMGSVLFHIGMLIILIGHLGGLLTPIWIFEAFEITHTFKQWLAIIVGGFGAILALIGGFMLLHRRLTDPRIRANSTFWDVGILVLLLAQLVLGVLTIFVSLQHLDGSEMVRFMNWAQGIFTFRADAWLYVQHADILFKLHIFLGLTIFLLFPFTRLVHMLSVPVRFLWRPGYQIVRSRRRTALKSPEQPRHPAE